MVFEHEGRVPDISPEAWVAPTATLCGDVVVAAGARIAHGACLVATGGRIEIGETCIVLEGAVIRSSTRHATSLGRNCLVGPHAHVTGCTLEHSCFIATGASVFHGAHLEPACEVRINGVVHVRTRLPRGTVVPIGWVAVGDPPELAPAAEHDRIWAVQERLDFPGTVYGVERTQDTEALMADVTAHLSATYGAHRADRPIPD